MSEEVDDGSALEPLIGELKAMIGKGLLTIENVQYLRL
jgi:hypothetical protein